jgi:hypothetical protein
MTKSRGMASLPCISMSRFPSGESLQAVKESIVTLGSEGQKPRSCTQRQASNAKAVRFRGIICLRMSIWDRSLSCSRSAISCAICSSLPSTRSRNSRQTRRQLSATSVSGTKDRVRILTSCGSDRNWNGGSAEDETGAEEVEELIWCERNARVIVLGLAVDAVIMSSGVEVTAETNDGDATGDFAGYVQNARVVASGLGVVDDMVECVVFEAADRVCSIRLTRLASPGNITSDSKLL